MSKYPEHIIEGKMTFPVLKKCETVKEKYEQAAYFIKNSKKIAVLTGAGMSTDSGIPDFRSKQGLYSKKPESILSLSHFCKDPKEVYAFLNEYIDLIEQNTFNAGHKYIASLENENRVVNVITQNIDGYHKLAGSSNVLELHGTLKTATCMNCGKQYPISEVRFKDEFVCTCESSLDENLIKPDIVLYDEYVGGYMHALNVVANSDLLLVLGTSLEVSPFNTLPQYVASNVPIIVINYSSTYLDSEPMALVFKSSISETLQKILEIKN